MHASLSLHFLLPEGSMNFMRQNQHASSTHAIMPIQWAIHASRSNFPFVFHLEISEIMLNPNMEAKGQKSAFVSQTCMVVLYAYA